MQVVRCFWDVHGRVVDIRVLDDRIKTSQTSGC